MVFPKPEETAVLTINGQNYTDWETVSVTQQLKVHPYFTFRFTCSEGMPLAKNWAALRIVPGMMCVVTLAGEPAVAGFVNTRQVFYDGRRHHIEIQGSSNVIKLGQASVISKTGEYKDITMKDFATKILKPFPEIKFLTKGGSLPETKFPIIRVSHGTSVIEAIEEPLRSLGHINLTSNVKGDLVAVVAAEGGGETLVEGGDSGVPRCLRILEGREILYNPGMAKGTYLIGQRPGDNQTWGAAAAHIPFAGLQFDSMAPGYAPQVATLEVPAWQKSFLKGRAEAGKGWQQGTMITVFCTVQGWLRPDGGLWEPAQKIRVQSPMLVMDGSDDLETKSVTFTQDNKFGTRTILECMNAAALGGFTPQGPGGG